ncbi:Mediator of DNA damage checkpoint protein 1 [Linnemannia zychae]|nr:Mediator of DNA damage checkpoint protein 1 [Linnemannia zychae]
MAETNKDDDDNRAVARLKFGNFRNEPERSFFLYKGLNVVGRDPLRCNVWLTEDFICREHLYIDVNDEEDIMVQDGPKPRGQTPTMFVNKNRILEQNSFYELTTTRKMKVAGLLTCQLEHITQEEREAAPLKEVRSEAREKAIQEGTHMLDTFVGEGGTDHRPRNSRLPITPFGESKGNTRRISNTHSSGSNNNSNSSHRARSTSMQDFEPMCPPYRASGSEHSLDSTQVIPDLTQVLREEEPKLRWREPLPERPVIPGLSPDITLQRPIRGGPGYFNGNSRADMNRVENSRQYAAEFDQQSNQPKTIYNEPTMVIPDDFSQDVSQSSAVLPETQPTQLLITTSVDIVASSLLQEDSVVDEVTSEEIKLDADRSEDRIGGSRSGSVVPESPQASQQDVIPCTPVDEIGQDRIPQTPEHQQRDQQDHQERRQEHTGMSDVSTLEANQFSTSIPDSQATQEAVGLSVSSSNDLPQHHEEDDLIVKVEIETERHFHLADSQNVRQSSPGQAIESEEGSNERTRAITELRSRRLLVKEVFCPDSQNSTQPSSRDRSKDDINTSAPTSDVKSATTITLAPTASPRQSTEQATATELRDMSQDSDRTASREGSPKHLLEEDLEGEEVDVTAPPKESSPKAAKLIKIETADSIFAAAPTTKSSRSRRGTPAGTLSKSVSADPIGPPQTGRFLRSHTGDAVNTSRISLPKNSVMISSLHKDTLKEKLKKIDGAVYNDDSYDNAHVVVFEGNTLTSKLMCAIARGLPIVTTKWIDDSYVPGKSTFLPPEGFLYHDEAMEIEFNFNLQDSCAKGKSNFEQGILLYAPYEFYCVTKKDRVSKKMQVVLRNQGYLLPTYVESHIRPLIEICGGSMMSEKETPNPNKKETTIIIGQTGDCAETQSYIEEGFKVVNKDFVRVCILRQTPDLDFETHAIPARTWTPADDDGEAAEQSDSTTSSARSRSASVAPLSRKSSTIKPQRANSTVSTSSSSSIPAAATKKKKSTKKK